MLRIHKAVAILHRAHPECMSDQGKNLRWDRFYHGHLPHLCNALGFAMADLLESEQADTSFYTLYRLARKMEANQEEDLFPPDPEVLTGEPPKLDQLERLSLHMMQAMSRFQCKECQCFVYGMTGHFARDCPHQDTFCKWHKEHLNSQGVDPDNKGVPTLKDPSLK